MIWIIAALVVIAVALYIAMSVIVGADERREKREGYEAIDVIGDGGVWTPHLDPERPTSRPPARIRDIEPRGA